MTLGIQIGDGPDAPVIFGEPWEAWQYPPGETPAHPYITPEVYRFVMGQDHGD